MKFKITETREFIIEAESFDEAEKKFMEMTHSSDGMSIEQISWHKTRGVLKKQYSPRIFLIVNINLRYFCNIVTIFKHTIYIQYTKKVGGDANRRDAKGYAIS